MPVLPPLFGACWLPLSAGSALYATPAAPLTVGYRRTAAFIPSTGRNWWLTDLQGGVRIVRRAKLSLSLARFLASDALGPLHRSHMLLLPPV